MYVKLVIGKQIVNIVSAYAPQVGLSAEEKDDNKHSHRPPHNHYNRHKINVHLIYTSIVYMHLATRGNNKILQTPPPHRSSPEEILPRLTHCSIAQLRKNKLPNLKSYLHKVDVKSYSSPVCSFCNIHTHIMSSTASTYTPRCHSYMYGHTPPD